MELSKVTCNDVNQLVAMCSISQEKAITSLKQCSSSLFVLLYQRLFNCTIKNIESSPYTLKQKKWNVTCVLNELRDKRGIDVSNIDAEEIVQLNEEHISRLIMLFLNIAYWMKLHSAAGDFSSDVMSTVKATSARNSLPVTTLRPVLAELPHESAEDGSFYVPMRPNIAGDEGGVPGACHVSVAHQSQEQPRASHAAQLDEGRAGHPLQFSDLPWQHQYDIKKTEKNTDGSNVRGSGIFHHVGVGDIAGMDNSAKSADENSGYTTSYSSVEEETKEQEIPTKQLVHAWNAEVIPPKRLNHAFDSLELADLRKRLRNLNRHSAWVAREQKELQKRVTLHPSICRKKKHDKAPVACVRQKLKLPCSLAPDTLLTDELQRKQPKRIIDYTLRNEKIEMLRSVRLIDDLQKDIRREMVHRHSDATRNILEEVRQALLLDKQEKRERMRQIKNEDERYRNAYKSVMAAACSDLRVAKELMTERTKQLAEYQSLSLRESRRMCEYIKRESRERMRHDLLRYASAVTGWQSNLVG